LRVFNTKKHVLTAFYSLFFLFAFVSYADAGDGSFANDFLGSPLLILIILIIIDAVAFVFHKIRK
jgi:hypothetical protein